MQLRNDLKKYCFKQYASYFQKTGVKEIWVQYGASDKTRFIPIHKLSAALGDMKCKIILKTHIWFGCDVTSKVGTRAAALKNLPENYLQEVGEFNDTQDSYQDAVQYLVKVWCNSPHSSAFDELRQETFSFNFVGELSYNWISQIWI